MELNIPLAFNPSHISQELLDTFPFDAVRYLLVNETEEDLFYKQYVSEGLVKHVSEDNTSQINYNYLLNDGVNTNLVIRPYLRSSAICSSLPLTDSSMNLTDYK